MSGPAEVGAIDAVEAVSGLEVFGDCTTVTTGSLAFTSHPLVG